MENNKTNIRKKISFEEKVAFTCGNIFLAICLLSMIGQIAVLFCPDPDYSGCNLSMLTPAVFIMVFGCVPMLAIWAITTVFAMVGAKQTSRQSIVKNLLIGVIGVIILASVWLILSPNDEVGFLALISVIVIMSDIFYIRANRFYK